MFLLSAVLYCPGVKPRLLYRFFIGLEVSSNCAIMPAATSDEIQVLSVCLGGHNMAILDFGIMYEDEDEAKRDSSWYG